MLARSGVLTLREELAGFGDPVIMMMGGLFVVGAAIFEVTDDAQEARSLFGRDRRPL